MKKFTISVIVFLTTVLNPLIVAYPQQNNFARFKFLIGEWVGSGGGLNSGQGEGEVVFKFDLDSNIIIRENYAHYSAQNNNPEYTHKDIMIIYYQAATPRAIYFDNEKHVINYNIEFADRKIIFTSDGLKGASQFRLTYEGLGNNKMKLYFDIAPPNTPGKFKSYLTAEMQKK